MSVHGDVRLAEIPRFIESRGLELAFSETCSELPVAQWVAQGMPGALDFWADPVTQPLNGLSARLAGGQLLEVKPIPRRATGPDLRALFVGVHSQIGDIERAHLVLRKRAAPPVRNFETELDRNPPLSNGEQQVWTRIAAECTRLEG